MATVTAKREARLMQVTTYVLELSEREAEILYKITGLIGGDPDESPRGDTDKIKEALRAAGVKFRDFKTLGAIDFEDEV